MYEFHSVGTVISCCWSFRAALAVLWSLPSCFMAPWTSLRSLARLALLEPAGIVSDSAEPVLLALLAATLSPLLTEGDLDLVSFGSKTKMRTAAIIATAAAGIHSRKPCRFFRGSVCSFI